MKRIAAAVLLIMVLIGTSAGSEPLAGQALPRPEASRDRVACDSWALAALKFFGAEKKEKLPYVQKSGNFS